MRSFAGILIFLAAVQDGSDIAVGAVHRNHQGIGRAGVDGVAVAIVRDTKGSQGRRAVDGDEKTNEDVRQHSESVDAA